MTYQTAPLNVSGGSYQSRSRPLSSQRTKNFYQQVTPEGREKFVLHSFPGLKTLSSITGADRGMTEMNGVGYRVAGNTLYSFDSLGVHTSIGAVSGSDRCVFANDGVNLFIVSSAGVFHYNGTSISGVTDSNIVGSTAVTFINNQFIYTNNNNFVVSDVGDGSSASGLNIGSAESSPDALVRAYVFQQRVYMFGSKTIELWYNSGTGSPPFTRMDGQVINIGLAAKNSIAQTDTAVYWLGDDRSIYRAVGATPQKVSSIAISHAVEAMTTVDDAYSYTFTLEGQNFYLITFPTENKTFVVNEELGENGWLELSSGTDDAKYQGSSILNIYGKNYVADSLNGKLYELDLNTYTNNSEAIQRQRVLSSINGDLFGQKGKRVQMSRLELILETGVGVVSGQGDNPRIMIEASYDGGRSWTTGSWMRVGRLGEFNIRAEWWNVNSFYDMIVRITTSDPVNYSIYSGSIDMRLAGR